ncbi:YozE family protein [Vagococcus coleopterorum]|uniref:UPF0346 protein G7081_05790 n=1 Tax=Vagococcus coleopterorum TaxID=2714946 RepID=A0A6G8ANV1_9ENTE|nr:YozE family protein [Vagococcus coleopterorum]QIL46622.1 YozE family protein [Vagococcus coleopterorum]
MKRSFYHYILTLRGPKVTDAITEFANNVGNDITFPKHTSDYDEVSDYLELSSSYLSSMDIFDKTWELYLENN